MLLEDTIWYSAYWGVWILSKSLLSFKTIHCVFHVKYLYFKGTHFTWVSVELNLKKEKAIENRSCGEIDITFEYTYHWRGKQENWCKWFIRICYKRFYLSRVAYWLWLTLNIHPMWFCKIDNLTGVNSQSWKLTLDYYSTGSKFNATLSGLWERAIGNSSPTVAAYQGL